jgi:PIN domain nuclease of toxin-antitoxin system
MRALLDTHALLWFLEDAPDLSPTARLLIENPQTEILFSAASLWEMAIKYSIGKLLMPDANRPFDVQLADQLSLNDISILPIKPDHIYRVASLPFHHRDPFDRLIVAQCLHEHLPLVSIDAVLDGYQIQRVW